MAVTKQASVKTNAGYFVSSLTLSNHTVASGSNRLLVVGVGLQRSSTQTVTGITWNGSENFSKFAATNYSGGNNRTEVWYLINPTAMTTNIVISLSGTAPVVAGSNSFAGAHQTTPLSGSTMTEGTGGVTSVISSESGDYPMCLAAWDFLGGGNPTCNDTTEWEQHQSPDNRVRGEMGSATGAASVTIDWDSLGGPSWTAIGFNIESSGVSVAIDESLSLSESLATGATEIISDSLSLSESLGQIYDGVVAIDESLSITETLAAAISLAAFSESLALTESALSIFHADSSWTSASLTQRSSATGQWDIDSAWICQACGDVGAGVWTGPGCLDGDTLSKMGCDVNTVVDVCVEPATNPEVLSAYQTDSPASNNLRCERFPESVSGSGGRVVIASYRTSGTAHVLEYAEASTAYATWVPGLAVMPATGSQHQLAFIRGKVTGVDDHKLHIIYTHSVSGANSDTRVYYNTATFAAGGYTLDSATQLEGPGDTAHRLGDIISGYTEGELWAIARVVTGGAYKVKVYYSSDYGATWDSGTDLASQSAPDLTMRPRLFLCGTVPVAVWTETGNDLIRARLYDGSAWVAEQTLTAAGTVDDGDASSPVGWDGSGHPTAGLLYLLVPEKVDATNDRLLFTVWDVSTTGITQSGGVQTVHSTVTRATNGGTQALHRTAQGKFYIACFRSGATYLKAVRGTDGTWAVTAQSLLDANGYREVAIARSPSCSGSIYAYADADPGSDNIQFYYEAI